MEKATFFFYPIFTLDSIVCSHHFFMSGAFYPFLWLCFEVWKHQRTQRIRRSKMLSEMSFRNTALCLRVFILHSFLHHSELLFVSKHISHFECPSLCCNLFHSLTDATHFHFVWYESLSLRSTKNVELLLCDGITEFNSRLKRAKGFLIIYCASCWNID